MYSELRRISKIDFFAKTIIGFQTLTIYTKGFILDVRLGPEYASAKPTLAYLREPPNVSVIPLA